MPTKNVGSACDNDRSGYKSDRTQFERIACPVAQIIMGTSNFFFLTNSFL